MKGETRITAQLIGWTEPYFFIGIYKNNQEFVASFDCVNNQNMVLNLPKGKYTIEDACSTDIMATHGMRNGITM